jgi:peptidoglycan/LPS O-acetylase OafA/YrhL
MDLFFVAVWLAAFSLTAYLSLRAMRPFPAELIIAWWALAGSVLTQTLKASAEPQAARWAFGLTTFGLFVAVGALATYFAGHAKFPPKPPRTPEA